MPGPLIPRLFSPLFRVMARQLAHPKGWVGRKLVTWYLNRGNRALITAALDGLNLSPDTRLLDVGFGGGLSLRLARQRGVRQLFGADPSLAAVEQLRATHGRWIDGGTLTLHLAGVEDLPLEDGTVDAVLSTNTVYFWPDTGMAFRQLRRVLRQGGTLALGFADNGKLRELDALTRHGFLLHDPEALVTQALEAGFATARLVPLGGRGTDGDCVLVATA